jgi:hypothetical protein
MDNLLNAIDTLSQKKAKGVTWTGYPAALISLRSDSMHDSGGGQKVIGLAPESVIGFDRNQ